LVKDSKLVPNVVIILKRWVTDETNGE